MYRNIDVVVGTIIYFSVLIYTVSSFILVEINTIKVISTSSLSDIAEVYANYIYAELGDEYGKWSNQSLIKDLIKRNIVCNDNCSIQFRVIVVVYEYNLTTIDLAGTTISCSNKLVETSNINALIHPHARAYRSKILVVDGRLRLLILEVISYVVMN